MSDEPPRRLIEVGTFPSGFDATFVDGADPATIMLREATARLDRMREDDEHARLAAIADAQRLANTRKARIARRFRRALKMLRLT